MILRDLTKMVCSLAWPDPSLRAALINPTISAARREGSGHVRLRWCDSIVLMVWLAVIGRWVLDFGIPHYAIRTNMTGP